MAHDNHGMEPIADLTEAELFVLWASRAWVTAFKGRRAICPTVRMGFRLAGIGSALEAVDRMFAVVATSTRRNLDFRCMTCPGLGGDEALLLRCVAGLQYGDETASQAVLADWLPLPQIAAARMHAGDFAAALAGAGLLIPMHRLARLPVPRADEHARGHCTIH